MIQRLGDIRPDPGTTQTRIQRDKTDHVINPSQS